MAVGECCNVRVLSSLNKPFKDKSFDQNIKCAIKLASTVHKIQTGIHLHHFSTATHYCDEQAVKVDNVYKVCLLVYTTKDQISVKYVTAQKMCSRWSFKQVHTNIVAAFRGMHVSPAKHSFAWLQRNCDYRTDTQTHTQRQTPDKVIPMCRYASQATQQWHKNHFFNNTHYMSCSMGKPTTWSKFSICTFLHKNLML